MRTALLRPALLSFVLAGCAGGPASTAQPAASPTPAVPAATASSAGARPADAPATSAAPARAEWVSKDDSEEIRYHLMADALRRRILRASELTEFDSDACNPGSLRTFTDTSKRGRQQVENDIDRLERLVISRGIDGSVDAPEMHDLFRLVISWEVGAVRPLWDVDSGVPEKRTIATGLSGEFRNPATGKCESYLPFDTATFVIPMVRNFQPPALLGVRGTIYFGEEGLRAARDAFFAAVGKNHDEIFTYTRIRASVVWQDYAVVAVNRPTERRAVLQMGSGGGGASYIFHRVNDEWRLVVIARTWG